MRFRIPGQQVNLRIFERVETTDNQYDIFDVGIEQEDGSIDSIVVGGSFSYAKSLCRKADEKSGVSKPKATADTPDLAAVPTAA